MRRLIALVIIIAILIMLIYIIVRNELLSKLTVVFCIVNFTMSIVWIWATSNILIDILNFIGTISGIPLAFLGLTLLSLGNSLPDASLNCSLSKNGYGEMAISGTFSGPFFNLVIGLGVSLLQLTFKKGDLKIDFFTYSNKPNLIAYMCLFVNIIFVLIIGKYNKFHLQSSNAIISAVIFVIYLCLISIVIF